MSIPKTPDPGKVFLSILCSRFEDIWPELEQLLTAELGSMDYQTQPFSFNETAYYDQELGTPILRRIAAFETLKPLDSLVDLKLFTNRLENSFAAGGCRLFNLDPGLLTLERLVLASGKNFTHRVYMGKGIWADLTLIFTRGDWQDLAWTFPDYASEKMKKHLRAIRSRYLHQLRSQTKG
ncbi:MAG: DUF4416 family protein [Desulfonatronovibrionaceae bacterium]